MAGKGEHISSDQARAASANSRINLPLNIKHWQSVPPRFHDDLLWFHQHILDQGLTWKQCEDAVPYKSNTIYQFLKGISQGSYEKFCREVRSYRKIAEKRASIQQQEFVPNSISKLMFAALDYTLANNCMSLVVGESGMGKSTIMKQWAAANNHGRSVYVDCPPTGGAKGFLGAIAHATGHGRSMPVPNLLAAVVGAFNANRILLLDNMHRALPADLRSPAKAFDIVQYIFDETGCAVAMCATARLDSHMQHSSYMFEQTTGRIGTPDYLPSEVQWDDIAGIVHQYIKRPNAATRDHAMTIANGPGHIRQLVERLKLASRIAHKAGDQITDACFLKAIQVRASLSKHNKNRRAA